MLINISNKLKIKVDLFIFMYYSCMKLNSYGRGALYKEYYPMEDLRKAV